MGGSGSTRWNNHPTKRTVEDGLTLDVTRLMGRIVPRETIANRVSWGGSIVWTNVATGKQTASIGYKLVFPLAPLAPLLELSYTVTLSNGRESPQCYPVRLSTTPCTYGGVRYWFHCPLCGARAGKLYSPYGERSEEHTSELQSPD